jgi:hypothetical protein
MANLTEHLAPRSCKTRGRVAKSILMNAMSLLTKCLHWDWTRGCDLTRSHAQQSSVKQPPTRERHPSLLLPGLTQKKTKKSSFPRMNNHLSKQLLLPENTRVMWRNGASCNSSVFLTVNWSEQVSPLVVKQKGWFEMNLLAFSCHCVCWWNLKNWCWLTKTSEKVHPSCQKSRLVFIHLKIQRF